MNILVTGATGFIGRNLVPALLNMADVELLLIVRDIPKAMLLFGENKRITYVAVNDMSTITQWHPEVVFHMAAFLTSSNDELAVNKLLESNIVFGTQLLHYLKDIECVKLFINFGTFAEYRYGPMEINNAYLYSATKTAFKQLLCYYAALSNYKIINVIPYSIYGGKDSQKKVLDYIRDSFNAKEPIKMTSGEQVLDFIHIDDVVSFLLFIITHIEKFLNESTMEYHLGTGQGHSIREVANILENKYKKKCNIDWGALDYREHDIMYAVAPIGKLISMGWHPQKKLINE